MIKYYGALTVENPTSDGGFDGALVIPAECFNKECTWYAIAKELPSNYDTSVAATYGRIQKTIYGTTHGDSKKWIMTSHQYNVVAPADATLQSDGTLKVVGDSGKRFYAGISYDLYIATPSWG